MVGIRPLEEMPVWLLLPVLCLAIGGALEIGFRLGKRDAQARPGRSDPTLGVIVGSVLGLLALLLAFTFNIAASRYEERRSAVLNEANAIGTAFLRADLLAETAGDKARALLREYVDIRVEAAVSGSTIEGVNATVARSRDIHAELWTRGVAATKASPTVQTNLYLQALNDVIDIHTDRVQAALHAGIPPAIWSALVVVTAIGLAMSGYQVGSSSGGRGLAGFGLVVALSVVLTLIADLDDPRTGFLRTTQAAMIDLRASIAPAVPDDGGQGRDR